jgi:hypothetical protein
MRALSACGHTSIGITVVPSGDQRRWALSGEPCHACATIRLTPFNFPPVSYTRQFPRRLNFGDPRAQCYMCMRIVALGGIYESENRNKRRQGLSACPR